ncbi:zinc finger protein CONSTANS-LIKE 16-like [Durio zibethinus]|uniref:Zinc finger protein CONSTANS-LIKE 16-like n=1 Tax=Durio zibethinus TaxID=66656 RepID=A0A6P5WGP8_DURZI|nr:zinc finger protein CONSTANS-LIKE 16-like [Durio zibethinus]
MAEVKPQVLVGFPLSAHASINWRRMLEVWDDSAREICFSVYPIISDKRAANAMGGKTATACDGCLRKRARWYCAADDAFLCQGCDTSVHSANQLASRHERVRFETASSRFNVSVMNSTNNQDAPPAWHQGFTRKARTPRQNKSMLGKQKGDGKVLNLNPLDPLVPEIGSEDGSVDENEEQLLSRVPVYNPFASELSNIVTGDGDEDGNLEVDGYEHEGTCELDDGLHGFLASDLDLTEFAADVESLLEVGAEEDTCCDIKGPELLDCKQKHESNAFHERKIMKVKDEEEESITACCFDSSFDVTRASLNGSFDYESPTIGEEEEVKVVPVVETTIMNGESKAEKKRNMLLRLNYESVITAWASQGSSWTTGSRPEFNPDDFMSLQGSNPKDGHHDLNGGIGGIYSQARGNHTDGEREARVSRYKEKRRMRLFSKKIRYEVRKLNAEQRPRMKGRFVKRTSFVGTASP